MHLTISQKGQVSLESLLIWAALAGALALFTPAFAHLMQAYALQEQALELKVHAQNLEVIFHELAFQAPGSSASYAWAYAAGYQFSSGSGVLELQLVHAALANPKQFTAHSPLPLEVSINPPFSSLIITRTAEGITIQSQ
ncbi:MAG: hypothetical protein IPJ89_00075 [Candidatus Iainarchaeum archaeon]|uniref:Uncharacterized protein n=1 Tax=Candidatus Iainarchaeum sp. TaxID=3101447 RepID=A0A7T9I146_9ARCH|nr:MAG: hypothetical protein IPJ89_00075 [Candidatus Diapherotrites archaeon]